MVFRQKHKKKLINASQKASCKVLSKQVKSVGNHLWWAWTTSEGDVELLREKYISILFCIQGKHEWTGHNKVYKMCPPKINKETDQSKRIDINYVRYV